MIIIALLTLYIRFFALVKRMRRESRLRIGLSICFRRVDFQAALTRTMDASVAVIGNARGTGGTPPIRRIFITGTG